MVVLIENDGNHSGVFSMPTWLKIEMTFLAKNFFILGLGEFASKVCGFVAFAYLARVLGPQEFGQLEFALALIFFLALVVDCGLGSYGAREIARDQSLVGYLTTHILLVRCLLGVFAFTLLAVLLVFLDKPWAIEKIIWLYGVTLLVQPGLLPWVFQGNDLMGYVALGSAMRWLFFAAGVLLLVHNADNAWMVPVIELTALLCVVTYYFCAFKYNFRFLGGRVDVRYALAIFRQAWPIGASELVWALKIYFATVLLGTLIYGPEVGWFGAAHRLVISLHAFVWLYFFNLLPSISRGSRGNLETLQRLMRGSLQITGWLGVFVAVVGTALARPVLTIVYGPQYEPAVGALQLLIWLIPLALVSGHFRYTLIAYDRQRLEFFTAACGGALNVVLNLTLITSYGIVGAAVSLVAAEGLICVLSYLMVQRTIAPIPVGIYLWKPVIGAAVLAGILYLLPPLNSWLTGASTVVIFVALLSASHRTLFADLRSFLARTRS
jgi:O-antigen/teichoic acid export membrane protein